MDKQTTIAKASQTEISVITTTTETVGLADLLNRAAGLQSGIDFANTEHGNRIAPLQKELDEVNTKIAQAQKLGVVETLTAQPAETVSVIN